MKSTKLIDCFPNWYTSAIFSKLGTEYSTELPWAASSGVFLDEMYFGNHSGEKNVSPLLDKMIDMNSESLYPEQLTDTQIKTLADIIYNRFGVQWAKLYDVLSEVYNPIENYSMTETETPNLTHTETPNITRSETPNITHNKTTSVESDYTVESSTNTESDIYGFNSNSPVPQGEGSGNSRVNTKGNATDNITTENETETGSRSESETGTRTTTETGSRTLTRSGNIGVTTSQQMIESEIKLWEWNFFETVFRHVDMVLTCPKYKI